MRKPLGCLSGYGLIVAFLVSVATAVLLLLNGGGMFSPGPLMAVSGTAGALQGITSHSELERECTMCHRPWRGVDSARCLACHTVVEDEIAFTTGLHGPLPDSSACVRCHTEHRGRDADITEAGVSSFPHAAYGFSLALHQELVDGTAFVCADCHAGTGHDFDPSGCAACHSEMGGGFVGPHVDDYGGNCLSCHDGTGVLADFDHGALFPLTGAHALPDCRVCHDRELTGRPPAACEACHQEAMVHLGQFGTDCAACHTADGWSPARLRYHSFPLDHGDPSEVDCRVCHPANYVGYVCAGCHEHQPAQIELAHSKKGITDVEDCVRCHPTGDEDG